MKEGTLVTCDLMPNVAWGTLGTLALGALSLYFGYFSA
jgi:hypothetical protein